MGFYKFCKNQIEKLVRSIFFTTFIVLITESILQLTMAFYLWQQVSDKGALPVGYCPSVAATFVAAHRETAARLNREAFGRLDRVADVLSRLTIAPLPTACKRSLRTACVHSDHPLGRTCAEWSAFATTQPPRDTVADAAYVVLAFWQVVCMFIDAHSRTRVTIMWPFARHAVQICETDM